MPRFSFKPVLLLSFKNSFKDYLLIHCNEWNSSIFFCAWAPSRKKLDYANDLSMHVQLRDRLQSISFAKASSCKSIDDNTRYEWKISRWNPKTCSHLCEITSIAKLQSRSYITLRYLCHESLRLWIHILKVSLDWS